MTAADSWKRQRIGEALWAMARHPYSCLLRRWNWKAAATSAVARGIVFFCANLGAGLDAARGAFLTELVLRGLTSGFYGTITQTLCCAEPRWAATMAAFALMPVLSHSIELAVHWLRGTEQLTLSIAASVAFTVVSTAFHLHVMRHGVLIVGQGSKPLLSDLRALPGLVFGFVGLRARGGQPVVDTRQ